MLETEVKMAASSLAQARLQDQVAGLAQAWDAVLPEAPARQCPSERLSASGPRRFAAIFFTLRDGRTLAMAMVFPARPVPAVRPDSISTAPAAVLPPPARQFGLPIIRAAPTPFRSEAHRRRLAAARQAHSAAPARRPANGSRQALRDRMAEPSSGHSVMFD
ncbi:hypothetical protein [Chromobacterium sphagni]|uniref:Uncharacterized protein n=1 Tax=Chromobacterium sphagni TaxID=1903179 RepID=A0ABX3C8F3_9NEIS|nr:hypothetical protein [Chromobacterium sphagni]OHX17667.1 hypothetical protein BI344_20635 [Chromobacterium sphagni]